MSLVRTRVGRIGSWVVSRWSGWRNYSSSDERTQEILYVPPYGEKVGELTEVRRARLLYQSRKRGMLENGLLFSTFAKEFLGGFGEKELAEYDRLLNGPSNEWDIFHWATGLKPTPPEYDFSVMKLFIAHVQNAKKESRLTQPDLY